MDRNEKRFWVRLWYGRVAAGLIAFAFLLSWAVPAGAVQELHLTKGQYFTLHLQADVDRVTVGDPKVLTPNVISPRLIRLLGLRYGLTNILVDYAEGGTDTFTAMVSIDVGQLRRQLRAILPDERDIRVRSNLGTIIMEGEISTRYAMETAIDVARPFANLKEVSVHRIREDIDRPEGLILSAGEFTPGEDSGGGGEESETGETGTGGTPARDPGQTVPQREIVPDLINLMSIAETPQVLLQVQVSEISRNIMKELGVNFTVIDKHANTLASSFIGGIIAPGTFGLPARRGPISSENTIQGGPEAVILHSGNTLSFAAFIDLMKQNGLVRILAEPNLIAKSGEEASFLAGGEFPIPVVQSVGAGTAGSGSITVQFKEFGVRLNFVPTVIGNDTISLRVRPEVSQLNFANAVTLSGFRVPALDVRRAETSIQLKSGQTYAIAGLLQHTTNETVTKIPALGDIPVLGPLFRSSGFQRNETELLVLVTPRLIRPLNADEVPILPTSAYVEPTDYDFYLWGRLEGRGPGEEENALALRKEPKRTGLVGAWGHYH